MLETLAVLLSAAVVAVPLSRWAGLGSVLGYLVAGVAIGPAGLRLITDPSQIGHVAELGVVMLLFLIGLELRPARLWIMRRSVFGLGSAFVAVSSSAIAVATYLYGVPSSGAAILGLALALSSTAIVLPMLAERNLLTGRGGRDAFAVLLFQDLAFIPLVALVPLLGGDVPNAVPWLTVAKAAGTIIAILIGGRFLLGPIFRLIGGTRSPEVFSIMALLTVVGTAALANSAGLSMSLGAFMAGVLLSESEYRHELQADIEPFEGVLLGFFFISVGMSVNLELALRQPVLIGVAVIGLLVVKAGVGLILARFWQQNWQDAVRFALALSQGSEFSFVLFGAAISVDAISRVHADEATLVIALSMMATPLFFSLSERLIIPHLKSGPIPNYDTIPDDDAPVIICGFGRVGQIVGRVLRMQGFRFTALERDSGQVDVVRRFGTQVYFGDPSRSDLLRAAGAEKAKILVIAIDDMEEAIRVVDMAKRNFPNLTILSRARNRRHVHLLLDRGIERQVRDTFHSSLRLSQMALTELGIGVDQAQRAVALFQKHDEKNLLESHAIYRDETQMIQSTQQAAEELIQLFETDSSNPRQVQP